MLVPIQKCCGDFSTILLERLKVWEREPAAAGMSLKDEADAMEFVKAKCSTLHSELRSYQRLIILNTDDVSVICPAVFEGFGELDGFSEITHMDKSTTVVFGTVEDIWEVINSHART